MKKQKLKEIAFLLWPLAIMTTDSHSPAKSLASV